MVNNWTHIILLVVVVLLSFLYLLQLVFTVDMFKDDVYNFDECRMNNVDRLHFKSKREFLLNLVPFYHLFGEIFRGIKSLYKGICEFCVCARNHLKRLS